MPVGLHLLTHLTQCWVSKQNISEPAKLSYLKACVRGDAKTIIGRLETNSNGNYGRARKLLTDRYNNPRSIIKAHLDNIVLAPVIKQENGPVLRRYLEKFEDDIEGLRQLHVDTSAWGLFLVYHIYQKLDNDTRRDFEIEFPGTAVQQLPELLKFLRERALALETYTVTGKTSSHGRSSQGSEVQGTTRRSFRSAVWPQYSVRLW